MAQEFPYGYGHGAYSAIGYYYGNSRAFVHNKEPSIHELGNHIKVKYCFFER